MNRKQAHALLTPVITSRLLKNNYGDMPAVDTIWVLATHKQAGSLLRKCQELGFTCELTRGVKTALNGNYYAVSGFEAVPYPEVSRTS